MLVEMIEWLRSVVTPTGVLVFCVVVAIIVLGMLAPVGEPERSAEPDELRYCSNCKAERPWHPTKGCSVCRTTEGVF